MELCVNLFDFMRSIRLQKLRVQVLSLRGSDFEHRQFQADLLFLHSFSVMV